MALRGGFVFRGGGLVLPLHLYMLLKLECTIFFSTREMPILCRPVSLVTRSDWQGGDTDSKLLSASFYAVMHQLLRSMNLWQSKEERAERADGRTHHLMTM